MKLAMHHIDSSSVLGCCLTIFLGWFAHITKSDIALTVTIIAGLTTIALNIKKFIKK
jgi:hypothetical protein